MEKNLTPNFLENSPIGEDLFANQSQEKIAAVLAAVSENDQFQIIGIEGTWGTGKSNLVKILERKLVNHAFFIYDVWGHQEDEQRRAILGELTEFITSKQPSIVKSKAKWSEKSNDLLAKRKIVKTTNMPYLSSGFIFSLFSIIYIPSVNAFKDADGTLLGVSGTISKILLVLFPIIILFGIYVYHFIKSWIQNGFMSSGRKALERVFQVYTNKQEQDTKLETISENEPSVKEFRSWMDEIDEDLQNTKLVLVFDNFDRLPKKHILSIWSSIHIFFSEKKYKNIKVIIPFDRHHLQNAFSDLDVKDKAGKGQIGKSDTNNFANDYINKTFDLVYRISKPILSDWKHFFRKKWSEAFPGYNQDEYTQVEQVYEAYCVSTTPREIIAFINQIVALYLLDPTIPLRYIAIFIIHQEEILKNPLQAITQPTYLKGLEYIYQDDEDLQKYLTALSYQINPDNALEIAYRRKLRGSLLNNDSPILNEIAKTSVFEPIIQSVVGELENYDNCILALDKLDNDAKVSDSILANIWYTIYRKVINETLEKFEIPQPQIVLLKHLTSKHLRVFIMSRFNQIAKHPQFKTSTYINIVDQLHKFLTDNNIDLDLFTALEDVETREIVANDFIVDLVEQKREDFLNYNVSTDSEALNQHLASLDLENLDKLTTLSIINSEYNLDKFQKQLNKKIDGYRQQYEQLKIIFKSLKELDKKPFDFMLNDSELYTLNSEPHTDFHYDILAMRIAKDNFSSSYAIYFADNMASEDKQLAKQVAQRIEYYINFGALLLNSLKIPYSPLYSNVIKNLLENSYGTSRAAIHDILVKYDQIVAHNKIDGSALLKRLNDWSTETLTKTKVVAYPNALFADAIGLELHLTERIMELIVQHFDEMTREEWNMLFSSISSKEAELLRIINYSKWSAFAKEALHSNFVLEITNKKFKNIQEWGYFFECMEKDGKDIKGIFTDARDLILKDSTIVTKEVFTFLLPEFIKFKLLEIKDNSAFRTFFKPEFLDIETVFTVIHDHAPDIKNLFPYGLANEVAAFKDAVSERAKESDQFSNLSKLLRIKVKKKDEEIE